MVMTNRRRWALAGIAALALGLAGAGPAQAAAQAPAAGVAGEIGVQDVRICDGGAQKRVYVRTDSSPTPIKENATWQPIPGMSVNFNAPNEEHILVTFSASAILDGQPVAYEWPGDHVLVRVLLDGVEMEPILGDYIFNTDVGQSNALQACKRVPMGAHTVTVEFLIEDLNMANVLVGQFDGKALTVQQSE